MPSKAATLGLSLAASVPYFVAYYAGAGINVRYVLKVLPIIVMLLLVLQNARRNLNARYARYIAIGLFFSAIGDVNMETYSEGNAPFFVYGLGAFLIAHIFYAIAFSTPWLGLRLTAFIPFGLFSVGMLALLLPGAEQALVLPVCVYAFVISFMAFRAYVRTATNDAFAAASGFVGEIIFIASDSIIAFNKFYAPVPHDKLAVMLTYYIGQALIAASVIEPKTYGVKRL